MLSFLYFQVYILLKKKIIKIMKKYLIMLSVVFLMGCSSSQVLTTSKEFPNSFDEAEVWIENGFQPLEINTDNYYILITGGDTIHVNKPEQEIAKL